MIEVGRREGSRLWLGILVAVLAVALSPAVSRAQDFQGEDLPDPSPTPTGPAGPTDILDPSSVEDPEEPSPTPTRPTPAPPSSPQPTTPGSDTSRAAPPTLVEAVDDVTRTVQGEPVQINFGHNDAYDLADLAEGDDHWPDHLRETTTILRQPGNGSAEVDEDDWLIIYIPDPGFTGADDFVYETCDAEDTTDCDDATVTVDVDPTGDVEEPAFDESRISSRSGPGLSGPCGALLAWGGFDNGLIAEEHLTGIGGRHRLEAQAAAAFLGMREAAQADGVRIDITDSYRTLAAQEDVHKRRSHQVAVATPGTSVHGWGRAVDAVVPGPVFAWLDAHAADYGWVNPAWAKRPGKSYEPWRWEYVGTIDDCGAGEDETEAPLALAEVPAADRRPGVLLGALGFLAVVGMAVGLWRRRQQHAIQ